MLETPEEILQPTIHHVCIVWCNIPDDQFFLCLDLNNEEYELVKTFSNQFINSTDISMETTKAMLAFFYTEEGDFKHKTKTKGPLELWPFDLVMMCGMFM